MKPTIVIIFSMAAFSLLNGPSQADAATMDDIALYRSGGSWFSTQTKPSPTFLDGVVTSSLGGFGASGAVPLLGDVDGNGIDDIVVIQGTPGAQWFAGHSTIGPGGVGQLSTATSSSMALGATANRIGQFMADVNGDGRDDGIFVSAPGGVGGITFSAGHSTVAGLNAAGSSVSLGNTTLGDLPFAGDFNGDGFDDVGVFRGGSWFQSLSGAGGLATGPVAAAAGGFGGPGDMPLVGDINGDGRDDAVIVRGIGSGGALSWFAKYSAPDGSITGASGGTVSFGADSLGDIPMLADINGDGRDDMILYRGGSWFSAFTDGAGQLSTAAGSNTALGAPTDIPLIGQFTVVPEPTSWVLSLLGLVSLAGVGHRRVVK